MIFSLPCLADNVLDRLGIGAVLKHIHNDDLRAVIVYWPGSEDDCIAAVAGGSDEELIDGHPPIKLKTIDLSEFLALTLGGTEILI